MEATKPTRVRFVVIALTTLAAVLLYLDRFCISFAERYIKEDIGLTNEQIGWILSAFFWTYALAQVPTGFLTDRFGARVTLTVYILLWSLFTGLTGLATGFAMLLALRFAFGVAQAGAFPASASLLSKWVPFTGRGFASSVIACGGRIGGFIAPMVTALLIVAFVPVDVSSLLTDDDIMDFPKLCAQLGQADEATRRDLLASLHPDYRQSILELGRHYHDELARAKDAEKSYIPIYSAEDFPHLLAALNEALNRSDLADAFAWRGKSLPAEAEKLLAQPASALTAAEIQRRNRLLLETSFPQAIKKVYGAGWRPAMMVFGLVGIAVGLAFWLWFRDRPDLHPACNAAEVHLIESSRPPGTISPHGKADRLPLGKLASSMSMWLMCLSQFGTNVGWVFLVTWLPRYLDEVHHSPIGQRSMLTSLPILAGWVGMLGGGWLTDWFTRRVGLRWGRALPIAITRFLSMGAYLVCLIDAAPPLWLVMAAFCAVAFTCDLGIPSMWAFNMDVGGRYVGSVLGWGNMWGNFGAAISPPLLVWVVGNNQWHLGFQVCALAFFVSGLCALGINASIPLVPRDEGKLDTQP